MLPFNLFACYSFFANLLTHIYNQLSPCRYHAITDKIQIPGKRGLTGNDSRYYRLSLLWTLNNVLRVSAVTRVDSIWPCYMTKLSLHCQFHFWHLEHNRILHCKLQGKYNYIFTFHWETRCHNINLHWFPGGRLQVSHWWWRWGKW